MKNQINILNIAGAVVSACLMVFLYFLPSLSALSLAKRGSVSKIQEVQFQQKPSLEGNEKLVDSTLVEVHLFPSVNEEKSISNQFTSFEAQRQEDQLIKLVEKCEERTESIGCPKNLEYFTQRPRPKQTPEECFSCRNLITCVCLADK